jgi:hypothetical protein
VDFREEVSAGRFPARNLLPADSKTVVKNTAFTGIFQRQRILFLKEWRTVCNKAVGRAPAMRRDISIFLGGIL